MKKILFLIPLLLVGCVRVSFDTERLKTNEYLGPNHEQLNGRLYKIYCTGNLHAKPLDVKTECLKETSKFVHSQNYTHFTILSQEKDSDQHFLAQDLSVFKSVNLRSRKKHSLTYDILLLLPNETQNYPNYYNVSDYYTPNSSGLF